MILDTNAISAFADANAAVLRHLQDPSVVICLPVIVLGEYRYGVKSSRQRAARARREGQADLFDFLEGSSQ